MAKMVKAAKEHGLSATGTPSSDGAVAAADKRDRHKEIAKKVWVANLCSVLPALHPSPAQLGAGKEALHPPPPHTPPNPLSPLAVLDRCRAHPSQVHAVERRLAEERTARFKLDEEVLELQAMKEKLEERLMEPAVLAASKQRGSDVAKALGSA